MQTIEMKFIGNDLMSVMTNLDTWVDANNYRVDSFSMNNVDGKYIVKVKVENIK